MRRPIENRLQDEILPHNRRGHPGVSNFLQGGLWRVPARHGRVRAPHPATSGSNGLRRSRR